MTAATNKITPWIYDMARHMARHMGGHTGNTDVRVEGIESEVAKYYPIIAKNHWKMCKNSARAMDTIENVKKFEADCRT